MICLEADYLRRYSKQRLQLGGVGRRILTLLRGIDGFDGAVLKEIGGG